MTQGQGGNGGVVPAVERTLRRARPVLHGLERFGAVAVPVIVIAVLSLFSTVGWLDRNMDRGQGEYLLFVEVAGSHTKLTLTVFLISVAVYTAVFLAARFLLRRVLGRADGRKAEGAPARESADADRSSRSFSSSSPGTPTRTSSCRRGRSSPTVEPRSTRPSTSTRSRAIWSPTVT
jgi:MFS superfamily sulfate permease-like transporter